ncbi:MAG: glycerol-3-phosphate 1-O-acyltransferase PlsY [Candidatus Heimdallarchaeota archaeon]|nr:glycerol-3-phosphate 1-O-acyltransferase PlsY [Candidatus Heimdallarchaeota archaeon]
MSVPDWVIYLLTILLGYLVGSIPTGYVLGKLLKNIDIRDYGSGNTGFSNVYRLLGPISGFLTLIGDILIKGYLVSWAVRLIIGFFVIEEDLTFYTIGFTKTLPQAIVVIAGLMAVVGHNWPVWLKFRGGKGMATTAGIFLGFVPLSTGLLAIVWIIVLFTTRYTSLCNLLTVPISAIFIFLETRFIMSVPWYPLTVGGAIAGLLIVWSHRENIQRLVAGEERKFGDKSERLVEDSNSHLSEKSR